MLIKYKPEKIKKLDQIDKKVIFFEWEDFEQAIANKYEIKFPENFEFTNVGFDIMKAKYYDIVCIKEHCHLSNADLDFLKEAGVQEIAIRIAGFNMLDVEYADKIGLKVYRVASYSPESIAEYAMSLILALARKHNVQRIHLNDRKLKRDVNSVGLLLKDRVIGLHGYGRIARELAKIARNGFGMKVKYFDPFIDSDEIAESVESLSELYSSSDIVSIHAPLSPDTKHSVTEVLFNNTKDDFMLINTARGAICKNEDIIAAFKSGNIKYLGIDVWGDNDQLESEFIDEENVIQTYHIAFFTENSVYNMITQTLDSISGDIAEQNKLPVNY